MRRPLLIGITGGIGSGKTTVCKVFESLGVPVYYADDRAKWLMANDPLLKDDIKMAFGKESFLADGELNRTFLAEKVFNSEKERQHLNKLVHPAVGRDFQQWTLQFPNTPYLLKEAALIFEAGSDKMLDYVINIAAPREIRIERIIKRDEHRTRQQIESIIEKQLSEEDRQKLTPLNINNDGQHLVIPQILAIHHQFIADNA